MNLRKKKDNMFFINSSFLLAQKRTKKGSRSLGPAVAGLPCAAHKVQTTRKVALLRRVVILHFIALLGCVKWPQKTFLYLENK